MTKKELINFISSYRYAKENNLITIKKTIEFFECMNKLTEAEQKEIFSSFSNFNQDCLNILLEMSLDIIENDN